MPDSPPWGMRRAERDGGFKDGAVKPGAARPHPHLLPIRRRAVGRRLEVWPRRSSRLANWQTGRTGTGTDHQGQKTEGHLHTGTASRSAPAPGRCLQPLALAFITSLPLPVFKPSYFFIFNGANYEVMSSNEVAPIKRNNEPCSCSQSVISGLVVSSFASSANKGCPSFRSSPSDT